MAKTRIGVRQLKNQLSATLARVRRGETMTVTDRNHAVAVIVPAGVDGQEDLIVRMLAKAGRFAWLGGKPKGLDKAPRVRGRSVSEAVVEDRR